MFLKIARLDGCSFTELPAVLNFDACDGNTAVSTKNGGQIIL